MAAGNGTRERRRYPRYRVREGTVVLLRSDSSRMICTLTDISLGGAGLNYVDLGKTVKETVGGEIVFKNADQRLDEVECSLVWDSEDHEYHSFFNVMMMRRSGVSFVDLDGRQKRRLQAYIDEHGLDEVPESGSPGQRHHDT